MRNPRKPDTWMNQINTNIMPYVDNPEWNNRYPTTDGYYMTQQDKKNFQETSERLTKALSKNCVKPHPTKLFGDISSNKALI